MSYKIQCIECTSEFTQRKNLYTHLRKCHKIEPIFSKKSEETFRCSVCSKLFSHKSTLAKHIKRLHHEPEDYIKPTPRQSRLLCPHESCDRRFANYAILRHHLLDEHSIEVEVQNFEFSSLECFETWKTAIEQHNLSLYTRDSSVKQLSSPLSSGLKVQRAYYNCHRSHFFRPLGNGVRCPRAEGSNKIGKACPSRMEVGIYVNEEEQPVLVKVTFWKTHCGHQLELERISLDSRTRAEIAERLQEGETFDEILESVNDPLESHPRLSLLKRKDLHNIARQLNIDIQRHKKRKLMGVNPWNTQTYICEEAHKFVSEEYDDDGKSISDLDKVEDEDLHKSPQSNDKDVEVVEIIKIVNIHKIIAGNSYKEITTN